MNTNIFSFLHNFAWVWAFFLPALVGLIYGLSYLKKKTKKETIFASNISFLKKLPASSRARLRTPTLLVLSLYFLFLLTFALARPREVIELPQDEEASNIFIALDVSRSMEAPDFDFGRRRVNRLEGVKFVSKEFVNARKGDRLGVVVFGQSAFLHTFAHINNKNDFIS